MVDSTPREYAGFTDAGLVESARGGDDDALSTLCARYLPLCRKLAGQYGGVCDPEDLIQEGMIGLLEAARRFDSSRGVPFSGYCRRCVSSKMLNAVAALGAQKRRANIGSLPLDERTGARCAQSDDAFFERIEQDEVRLRGERLFSLLSHSERDALRLYLRGFTYVQIAARLGLTEKSVDNALQRARKKLRSAQSRRQPPG